MTTTATTPRAEPASTPLAGFDALLGRPVSMRAMALLRVLVGPVVLLHLRPILDAARHGRIYRDAFYEPYARWYPELPRGMYIAMLWVAVVAALAMTIGLLTRLATIAVFTIVTYDVFLSTTNMHNNRAYLMVVLGLLAVAPCDRELSVDAWLRKQRGRPALPTSSPGWPLWLLRFEAGTVYAASGLSKLLDHDWFSGTVTWQRVVLVRDRVDASVLPSWAVDVLTNRSFHTVAAKLIIATELFIAAGLWSRRTRYAAVWLAICFHVAIELSAEVQVFSYLAIAALVIWAVPSTRGSRAAARPCFASAAPLCHPRSWPRLARQIPDRVGAERASCLGRRSRWACGRGWMGGAVRAQPATADCVVRATGAAVARRAPSPAGEERDMSEVSEVHTEPTGRGRGRRAAMAGGELAGCRRDRLRRPRPAGALPPADRSKHRAFRQSGGAMVHSQPEP